LCKPSPLFLFLFLSCSSTLSCIKEDRAFAYNAGRDACDLHSEQDRLWLCTSCICLLLLSPSSSSAVPPFSSLHQPSFSSLTARCSFLHIGVFNRSTRKKKKDDKTENEEWPYCTRFASAWEEILIITLAQARICELLLFFLSSGPVLARRFLELDQYH
jgi:hypothetical protein